MESDPALGTTETPFATHVPGGRPRNPAMLRRSSEITAECHARYTRYTQAIHVAHAARGSPRPALESLSYSPSSALPLSARVERPASPMPRSGRAVRSSEAGASQRSGATCGPLAPAAPAPRPGCSSSAGPRRGWRLACGVQANAAWRLRHVNRVAIWGVVAMCLVVGCSLDRVAPSRTSPLFADRLAFENGMARADRPS
jgi:hypothetical protein